MLINYLSPKKLISILAALGLITSFLFVYAFVFATRTYAAVDTCTWDGTNSDNWNDATSWTGCDNGTLPEDGDSLLFPATPTSTNSLNDFVGLEINDITFDQGGYTINVGNLTMTGDITTNNDDTGVVNITGAITLNNDMTITANAAYITMDADIDTNGNDLYIDTVSTGMDLYGAISGIGNLIISGTGDLYVGGANTFSGDVTISSGQTVYMDTTNAFGDTTGDTTIASGAQVYIESGGTVAEDFSISGVGVLAHDFDEAMSGDITLLANASITNDAELFTISGNINLGAFTLTIEGTGGTRTDLSGVISGTGGITKEDTTNGLDLLGNNTYQGATLVNAGTLGVGHNNALGTTDAGTTVVSGATVYFAGGITSPEDFTISGTGVATGGALQSTQGVNTLSGDIVLAANSIITNATGGVDFNFTGTIDLSTFTLTFVGEDSNIVSGVISGTGGLIKNGSSGLVLSANNTYSGSTLVNSGLLTVRANDGLGTTAGSTTVVSGASVVFQNSITVPEDFTISGTGAGAAGALVSTADVNTLSGDIVLAADAQINNNTGGVDFNFTGTIDLSSFTVTFVGEDTNQVSAVVSGTGGIIKEGTSGLVLSANNDYTGSTVVNSGLLLVRANDGLGTTAGTTTINTGATASFENGVTVPEDFIISGTGLSGSGALRDSGFGNNVLVGDITLAANATIANWSGSEPFLLSGTINLASFIATFDGADTTNVSAVISGTGGITKAGSMLLNLSGDNAYTGQTQILSSYIAVSHNNALGTTAGNTVISSGAGLTTDGVASVLDIPENISVTGVGDGTSGVINQGTEDHTYSGIITLTGNSMFNSNGAELIFNRLAGTGDITIEGPGTVRLAGGVANSYSGSFIANGTTVLLFKTTGITAITGPLTITDGLVQLRAADQIADTSAVSITTTDTLDLNDLNETVGSITGAGNIDLGTGTLTTGGNDSSTTFSGVISGTNGDLTKIGTGTLTLTGTNTYTGTTTASAGILAVNGSQTSSAASINGGRLRGTGTVGEVNGTTGTLAPGNSPGIINVVGDLNLSSPTVFEVEIDGTTVGSQYDQTAVTGNVTLINPTLDIVLGFTPAFGDVFTIIDATGTVTGTFNGLSDGEIFNADGSDFRIDYNADTVTLTVVDVEIITPTPTATPTVTPTPPGGSLSATGDTVMFTAIIGLMLMCISGIVIILAKK